LHIIFPPPPAQELFRHYGSIQTMDQKTTQKSHQNRETKH
jgi:hypothetical protein